MQVLTNGGLCDGNLNFSEVDSSARIYFSLLIRLDLRRSPKDSDASDHISG